MQVTQFGRLPTLSTGYSIDRVFRQVRSAMPEGFPVAFVDCPTPADTPWWLFKGIARAWAGRTEVNHITGDVHYVALGLPGNRALLTVCDLNRLDMLHGLRKRLYELLYFTLPLRRCRIVAAISQFTRQRIVERYPFAAGKVVVIPCCLPEGFVPRPKAFNTGSPRILQIGTRSNKNLERVAQALHGERCVFHMIGRLDEAQRRLLKDLNINYENDFDVDDEAIVRAYEKADMVVFASLAEGFGMPIIEANAIGRPVLTSRLSPMKDVAGEAACLVDPYDAEAIRAGIHRITSDEPYRHDLVERGYENAKRYSARAVAGEYAKLYRQILDGKPARRTWS